MYLGMRFGSKYSLPPAVDDPFLDVDLSGVVDPTLFQTPRCPVLSKSDEQFARWVEFAADTDPFAIAHRCGDCRVGREAPRTATIGEQAGSLSSFGLAVARKHDRVRLDGGVTRSVGRAGQAALRKRIDFVLW